MPKIIVTSRYLKSNASQNISNYVKYIATRKGSVAVNTNKANAPATQKQQELIASLLKDFPESKSSFAYQDYQKNPDMKNASALITEILELEHNADRVGNRENYVGYLANRPGAVKFGLHGLFSQEDTPIDLEKVADEIAHHSGNVWTHVVSLRREDAQQTGFDNLTAWRELIKRQIPNIAKQTKIDMKNLKWYAAFHDKETNPHVHIIIYSTDPKEGFLTNHGIEKIRSGFANDIYHDELYHLYGQQTDVRNLLKIESSELMKDIIQELEYTSIEDEELMQLIVQLQKQLAKSKGKKTYGYLKKSVKQTVDEIFSRLVRNDSIQKLYSLWCELEQAKHDMYSSAKVDFPALEDNQEFRSVKNMIVRTVAGMKIDLSEMAPPDFDYGENFSPDDFEWDDANISKLEISDFGIAYQLKWSKEYKQAHELLIKKNPTDDEKKKCVGLLISEAKNRNVLALYDLGKLYSSDYLGEPNEKKSQEYYKKALQGFLDLEILYPKKAACLQYRISQMYADGLGTEQDKEKALEWLEKSAESGNINAQYRLANQYYYSEGAEKDLSKVFHWYSRCAEQEHPYASYAVAQIYAKGESVPQNAEKANQYYAEALKGFLKIENPDGKLLYRIGRMFEKGLGTDKNYQKALEYFIQSDEKGNLHARGIVGREYLSGKNLPQDMEKGIEKLSECSENGDWYASYRLAEFLLKDTSYYNAQRAIKLLKETADKNHWASFLLGKVYLFGMKDLERNREQALAWLTKSMNEGNPYAEELLHNMERYEHRMLTETAFGLFVGLSRIIEEDYHRNQKRLNSQVDSKLRRMIQKKKKELGIKEDTGQQQNY